MTRSVNLGSHKGKAVRQSPQNSRRYLLFLSNTRPTSIRCTRLWDVAKGKASAILGGHDAGVSSAVFSLDGSRVVTASLDNTAAGLERGDGEVIAVATER
jgi:WD40 repeat protein